MKTLQMLLEKPYGLSESLLANLLNRFLSGRGKTRPEDILTWPNFISVLRIPLGIGVWYFSDKSVALASMMFGAAMMSDHIDGTVARINGPTKAGEMVDPTCDKIFFALCVLAYKPSFTYWIFSTIIGIETF